MVNFSTMRKVPVYYIDPMTNIWRTCSWYKTNKLSKRCPICSTNMYKSCLVYCTINNHSHAWLTYKSLPSQTAKSFFSHTSKCRLVYKHCKACCRGKWVKSPPGQKKQLRCSLEFFSCWYKRKIPSKVSHICLILWYFIHLGPFRNCKCPWGLSPWRQVGRAQARNSNVIFPSIRNNQRATFRLVSWIYMTGLKSLSFFISAKTWRLDILDVAFKHGRLTH